MMIAARRILCLLLPIVLVSCLKFRKTESLLIPESYVGWVRIEYAVAGQPPLPVEKADCIVTIPAAGFLRTSSQLETGWGNSRYYYVSTSGQRRELALAENPDHKEGLIRLRQVVNTGRPGEKEHTYVVFFVGPQLAFERAPKDFESIVKQ